MGDCVVDLFAVPEGWFFGFEEGGCKGGPEGSDDIGGAVFEADGVFLRLGEGWGCWEAEDGVGSFFVDGRGFG